jgi:hypothetical protein
VPKEQPKRGRQWLNNAFGHAEHASSMIARTGVNSTAKVFRALLLVEEPGLSVLLVRYSNRKLGERAARGAVVRC